VLYTPCDEPQVYCTAKTTSIGCVPSIEAVGWPSLAGGSFQVRATNLHNNVTGLLIWSSAPDAAPFQGGTLCVASPIFRTPAQVTSGGTGGPTCIGTLGFTFGPAYQQQQGFSPGQSLYTQVWSRDGGDPFGSSLSDALSFTWCP